MLRAGTQTHTKEQEHMRTTGWVTAGIMTVALTGTALAHHAMEYIEMESYTTARRGESVLHLHYDYMVDDAHWAIGAKTPVSSDPHGIAAGIEVMGSFDEPADNWSVLPGVYMPLGAPNITLKSGLEFGEADGADTTRANVTLLYRF